MDAPTITMTPYQLSLVVALDEMMGEAGLTLVCPNCAAEGHFELFTSNAPGDPIWRIDCQCRRRWIRSQTAVEGMAPIQGDLLMAAKRELSKIRLQVRRLVPTV